MDIYFQLGVISIAIFAFLALVLIILIFIDREKLNNLYQKKEYIGGFHGSTFYSQPFLTIEEAKDEKLNKIIRKHNKKVVAFYLCFLFLIIGIVFLNIGEE